MDGLWRPFAENGFLLNALLAGILVSVLCACAGTFVVLRGLAFVGDALAHGVLPGVAVAVLLGVPSLAGAALGAIVMMGGVGVVQRRTRLSADTAVGLLIVGMLGLGVIITSRSTSFRGDLTALLFGEILGVRTVQLWWLAAAAVAVVVATSLLRRPFLLLVIDPDLAQTSGFRAARFNNLMMALIGAVVIASFRTVGTLLVFGMLVAPAATAALLTRRLASMMLTASMVGSASTYVGLLVSYHHDLAAGATVVVTAVAFFVVALVARGGSSGFVSAHPSHAGHVH
ncbi:MAG: metal ABC transporter permease [Actinomycetota bacterium]